MLKTTQMADCDGLAGTGTAGTTDAEEGAMRLRWTTDVLGQPWSAATIPVSPDLSGEPPPVATLVRYGDPDPSRPAILYLHGFVDYFFQAHVGRRWQEQGFAFYALDLRRHGRSLQPGETANYVTELATYREELDLAASYLRDVVGHRSLAVVGHSTGGLVASLWAAHRSAPGPDHAVDALVLNSPWLDLAGPWFEREVATRAVAALALGAPRLVVGHLGVHYGPALHRDTGGEWSYDLHLKPHTGFPVRAGWLAAVRRGHHAVARGLGIACPVLVMTSDRSGDRSRWHPALVSSDSVLDVEQIAARAPCLGDDVTVRQIAGGGHDLALSPEPARSAYLDGVARWLHEER